ncbi:hypothetical protein G6R40_02160 [Chryseobacterium sp. POL2]|uniref:DUF6252 family protein n=1 Tax=Chryseobacterium sp. POL2 TaxID=2713414 RepID=UPI0013E1626E|nr:DUF6252 family protein [Chryseobacterium sp. POL2]QIG88536.1 hypothetical protein G6R40_02160 [Chryseobacterium sp. POL2]
MKNLFLLSLLTIGLFTACKDREPDPNVLPQATQSGKNTAGALVDGKVWVATTEFVYPPGTVCENFGNKTKIVLDLRKIKNMGRNSIDIKIIIENLELNKTYELNQNPVSDFNYAIYTNNEGISYSTQLTSDYTGKIKITRIDLQNQIVSGTFEFKAIDHNGNVVNITDGRFDKKFD